MGRILTQPDEANKHFRDTRTKSEVLAKTKATDAQWDMIGWAINAFIAKYPRQWMDFQDQLNREKNFWNPYKLATKENKELRQANWRNVAVFPIIEDAQGNEIDSLLPVLKKIIPGLTHKKSVNFAMFINKFPIFNPGEKY